MKDYQAKRGGTDRVALVWFDHHRFDHDAGLPKPLVLDGGEIAPLLRKPGEKPDIERDDFDRSNPPRCKTAVVLYKTDDEGRLITKDGRPQLSYDVLAWEMNDYHRRALEKIAELFPLHNHDLLVECYREENQNLRILPTPQGLWHRIDAVRDDVIGKAETLIEGIISSEK